MRSRRTNNNKIYHKSARYLPTATLKIEERTGATPTTTLKIEERKETAPTASPIIETIEDSIYTKAMWFYNRRKQNELVITALTKVLTLLLAKDPTVLTESQQDLLRSTYFKRGNLYQALGQHQKALDDFQAYCPLDKVVSDKIKDLQDIINNWNTEKENYARAQRRLKEYKEKFGEYLTANIRDLRTSGDYERRRGNIKEAIKWYETIDRFNPNSRTVCSKIGQCHYQLGEFSLAERWLAKSNALQRMPYNEELLKKTRHIISKTILEDATKETIKATALNNLLATLSAPQAPSSSSASTSFPNTAVPAISTVTIASAVSTASTSTTSTAKAMTAMVSSSVIPSRNLLSSTPLHIVPASTSATISTTTASSIATLRALSSTSSSSTAAPVISPVTTAGAVSTASASTTLTAKAAAEIFSTEIKSTGSKSKYFAEDQLTLIIREIPPKNRNSLAVYFVRFADIIESYSFNMLEITPPRQAAQYCRMIAVKLFTSAQGFDPLAEQNLRISYRLALGVTCDDLVTAAKTLCLGSGFFIRFKTSINAEHENFQYIKFMNSILEISPPYLRKFKCYLIEVVNSSNKDVIPKISSYTNL
jgi:tetratricopeptide (TPR) repeat protein